MSKRGDAYLRTLLIHGARSVTLATVMIGNTVQTVALGAIQRSGGTSSGIAPHAIKPAIKAKRRVIYWKSRQVE